MQAPRQCWKKLHSFLRDLGFVPNNSDICFYALHLASGAVLLLLYVDDILLAAFPTALVEKYAALTANTEFQAKDLFHII